MFANSWRNAKKCQFEIIGSAIFAFFRKLAKRSQTSPDLLFRGDMKKKSGFAPIYETKTAPGITESHAHRRDFENFENFFLFNFCFNSGISQNGPKRRKMCQIVLKYEKNKYF